MTAQRPRQYSPPFIMASSSHTCTVTVLVVIVVVLMQRGQFVQTTHIDGEQFFAEWFVANYGHENGSIDVDGLAKLLEEIKPHQEKKDEEKGVNDAVEDAGTMCNGNGWLSNSTCLQRKCLLAPDIFELHSVTGNSVNASGLQRMSTTVLYTAVQRACTDDKPVHKYKSSRAEAWGYGLLATTITNMCAFGGVVVMPVAKSPHYRTVLMFMVALAVGTLSGSALLVLIPESFDMSASEYSDIYVWRLLVVIAAVYAFFVTERIMGNVLDSKKAKKKHAHSCRTLPELPPCSITIHTDSKPAEHLTMPFETPSNTPPPPLHPSPSTVKLDPKGELNEESQVEGVKKVKLSDIKGMAWMIIMGDGLHNFVDGLSIGATFAQSPMAGISISIAVFCEELPHELGDFAILLNSGMTIKQALCFNFLCACISYVGFVIGVLLGETPEGSFWIFSVSAGMFLYIALVDMLPEVNKAGEDEVLRGGCRWRSFVVQNIGMLTGWGVILILAIYSGHINFEK